MPHLRPTAIRHHLRASALLLALVPAAATLTSCGFDYPTDRVNTIAGGTNNRDHSVDALGIRVIYQELNLVPHLSVAVGVVLAVASLAVLVFFIHHVARSIQAEALIARVAAELDEVRFHSASGFSRVVYSNVTGKPHGDSESIKRLLVQQIVMPWSLIDSPEALERFAARP